jgi:tetratricopeptide (TPR) repeat protein
MTRPSYGVGVTVPGDKPRAGVPPTPDGIRTLDELVVPLRRLQAWAGCSEREIHRRVRRFRRACGIPEVPAYDTVHRCFQLGRRRLDVDLLVDVARVMLEDGAAAARWRDAHARIIGEDTQASLVTVSGSLPDDLTEFTGRSAQLRHVLRAVDASFDTSGGAPVVVFEGMAGVGKTSLAVHTAHHLKRRVHVDTVLWTNLHGYARDLPPADPVAVLGAFLRRLGMSAERVRGLDAQGRRRELHERLAGRRTLVVLDDTATAAQVRPLLVDVPTCVTLVTSRSRVEDLAAAHRLRLDVFDADESLELLRRTIGAQHVDSAPDTVACIADSVGHLPLALGMVAGRIRSTTGWTLADHLERLTTHRERLRSEERVERALALSYEGLSTACRAQFRLLALHPGPELDRYTAAALAGTEPDFAERQLDMLLAAHLLRQCASGRYTLHDLVRIYATSRSHDEDPARARRAALSRLRSYYRVTASLATEHHLPYERGLCPPPGSPPTPVPALDDRAAATAWLERERPGLIATAVHAANHFHPEYTAELSAILAPCLDTGGHYQEAETLHRHAARTPEPAGRARALFNLGVTCWRLDRCDESLDYFGEAAKLYRDVGDRVGESRSLGSYGEIHQHQGDVEKAAESFDRAIALLHRIADDPDTEGRDSHCPVYEPLGRYPKAFHDHALAMAIGTEVLAIARKLQDRFSECRVLGSMGSIHRQAGYLREALEHLQAALSLVQAIGYRFAEVDLLNELGATWTAMPGREATGQAVQCYREAAALAGVLGDRYHQARAWDGIARCRAITGYPDDARSHWQSARDAFRVLGADSAAEAVTARLRTLDT